MKKPRVDAALALQSAVAAHQTGDLAQARRLYKTALAAAPENFDALHLLGLVESDLGQHAEAARLIGRALRLRANWAPVHTNLGNVLAKAGRTEEALASYDRALTLDAADVLAWTNRGNALAALGQAEAALASHDKALALAPGNAEAQYNRAAVLDALERPEEALAAYDRAIANAPDYADAHFNRGNTLMKLDRLEDAQASFARVVAIDPSRHAAWFTLGQLQTEQKHYHDAIASFEQVLTLQPRDADALKRLGLLHFEVKQYYEALACFERVLALKPDDPEMHNARGVTLEILRRMDDAMQSYDQALALKPADPKFRVHVMVNRGTLFSWGGDSETALACAREALAIVPDHVNAHFLAATSQLRLGDLQAGWAGHEWRLRLPQEILTAQAPSDRPQWRGETALAGRTILVRAEQGFGDTLQFCRFIRPLAAAGGRVVFEVQPGLWRFLHGLAGVAELIAWGDPLPAHELQCPLLSLPYVFGTELSTIPCEVPYVQPDRALLDTWARRLGPRDKPRVGLAWSGNLRNVSGVDRPIPLPRLLPGLPLGFSYHCLQKEIFGPDEAVLRTRADIVVHSAAFNDFADTAALMSQMDLVVSIDTAIAHLAGALGLPVWILLSQAADWRWLIGRSDSPWYPTARLFRQESPEDWDGMVHALRAALAERFGHLV
jgi:tetratricopeptide (TPR) repeat protein